MWLNNLCVFLATDPLDWSTAELEQRLADALCPECGSQSPSAQGFVPPLKADTAMVHIVDGLAVCMHQEITRMLPAAVVAEAVDDRVEQIETAEGRKVSRREKADIKDEAHFELLPRAFTRSRRTLVVLDLRDNRVWVDCAAQKRAEQVVSALRSALGTLPVTRADAAIAPRTEMSRWLAEPERLPNGFEVGDRCVLESDDDSKSSVRVTAMDLQRDEVKAHLGAGLEVVRINLAVDDALEFDLDDNLDLKRLRPLDLIQDDLDAVDAEDAVAELQARISLQGQALRGLLARIYTHFGVAGALDARAA